MKKTFLILLALTVTGCSGGKKNDTQSLGPNIVANINGNKVSLEEFNQRYEWYVKRYKFRIPKSQFLKNLVDLELSSQEAIRQKLDQEKKMQYDYKILLSQHLLEKEVYSQFDKIKLSDSDLKAQFEKSPEIKASHILFKLKPQATEADVKKVRAQAQKVLTMAKKKGANFAKLAKKYSQGPSKKNGGDLDYFTKETMVPEFSGAAFALKNLGDISGLVRTKYGFHIIKLTGRRDFSKSDKRRLRSRTKSLKQKEIYDVFFNKLKGKATVLTNEKLISE